MAFNESDILAALRTVEDPDLKKDLVTLGMIQNLQVSEQSVAFTVVLTTPACPLKELIKKNCIAAVRPIIGETTLLNITMTANVTTINANPALPLVKNVIAVASGKGGVGKSTVTCNLALALASTGSKVGIIDADIFGPSIPTMFDCENMRPGVMEKPGDTPEEIKYIILPIERYGIKLLSIGFIAPPDGAVVWRGPMATSAIKQFINDTDWGELDYLLIDLPPGTSDIHLSLVQTVSVTGAVVVTTPQRVALADAQKAIAMFTLPQINVPILGVVENMSYFTPAELPNNRYYLFGKDGGKVLAKRNDVPFLGEIPLVQRVREAGDEGTPVIMESELPVSEAFKEIAGTLAQNVAIRNANKEKTKVVEIKR
ncbi:MAG: iron-sulfur cluster carrier protein ApbC [Cytophagales bacterium]|nr:MAG: iron-sulfur cluster carrier protein ApbC [Cytophagales bacterium]TAF59661.1 MAG: iron-sulfur cluster carrier protein ApbC [Cytophagales bacterium]